MRKIFASIGLLLACNMYAQLSIMSYNVENFFFPETDSINPDTEFTQNGNLRWSFARYNNKAEQIARVIANANHPSIVCLNEVEERRCLQTLCRKMPHYPYKIIHFDSPDKRGIDVAVIYDSTLFTLHQAQPFHVPIPNTTTRDILYAKLSAADTLHLLACHLPSQTGGAAASQFKRDIAKQIIAHITDSILQIEPSAKIIVCGDMNMAPKNDLPHFHNKSLKMTKNGQGTHKYKGQWTCLDQFYVSQSLNDSSNAEIFAPDWLQEEDCKYLGLKPKRTFNGFRYNRSAFSDHLPILLHLNIH